MDRQWHKTISRPLLNRNTKLSNYLHVQFECEKTWQSLRLNVSCCSAGRTCMSFSSCFSLTCFLTDTLAFLLPPPPLSRQSVLPGTLKLFVEMQGHIVCSAGRGVLYVCSYVCLWGAVDAVALSYSL